MKLEYTSSKALLIKIERLNLFNALVMQIQKDFNRANIELQITKAISSEGLEQLLQEKLYVLLLERFDEYLNLLYVIDIPEKSLKEVKSEDVVEVSKEVSLLLLKREFQKVYYRSNYSE